jgi:predicted TPR repeat methyltransferase
VAAGHITTLMRGRRARSLQAELDRALALHREGRMDEAARLYRQLLKLEPGHFDVIQLLGTIEGQQGHFAQALELLNRAVALQPGSARAHNNLGNTLGSLKRHDEALACFEKALALQPDNPKTLRNRAHSLRALKRPQEALDSLDRALALDPTFAEAMVSRGELLQEMQRHDEAIVSFRGALAGGKDTQTLHYALASLGAEPPPTVAPPDYVRALFDQYAQNFDAHLVATLNYRAPGLIAEALRPLAPGSDLNVVDLGCGTGLCGPLLRPLARRLTGVDLSDGMLAKARESGHYDELVCAELVAWLAGQTQHIDLAVAADVLIYIGDLQATMQGVRQALRPSGLFAFTVEHDPGNQFSLKPSRRYTHSPAYLRTLAADTGFEIVASTPTVLREEDSRAVDGHVVVFRRRA